MSVFFSIEINALFFSVLFLFVHLMLKAHRVNSIYSILLILMLLINLLVATFVFPANYSMFASFTIQSLPEALFVKTALLMLFVLFFTFLLISNYSFDEFEGERFFLYLVILIAGLFLAGANDPLTAFIFIEMISLSSFGIISLAKTRHSYEAATRYLIFSSIASCFFIVSFIFDGSNHYQLHSGLISNYSIFFPNFLTMYGSTISQVLLIGAFFIKFGLGPYAGWLADTYEASKFRDFVFISTVGKLPLVIAFCQVVNSGIYDLTKYFFIAFIFIYAIVASILMVKQKKIRRFFAYSSLFNFSLIFIMFLSSTSFHSVAISYFFYYCVVSMLGYFAFDLYKLNNTGDNSEPAFLDELPKFSTSGGAMCFATAIVMNSGLPPLGIFLMKATALGFFMTGNSYTNPTQLILITLLFLLLSTANMFAYFKFLSRVLSFERQSAAPAAINIETANYELNYARQSYNSIALFSATLIMFSSVYYLWMFNI